MSSLQIEERFELDAPADQAWAYLTQPERIVVCLPGAELTEVIDELNYSGTVQVKLGAVSMEYRGTIEFTEVDNVRRLIRMAGKGSEKRGGGNASLKMEGLVEELDGGRSAVTVVADIQLAGKIVRFGRGMIQAVTAEVFKEFTRRLATELTASAPGEPGGSVHPDELAGDVSAAEGGVGGGPPSDPDGSSPESLALLPILIRSFRSWLRRLFGGG
jgi:carbon monoxide dehydrogenase subunit G